MILRRFHTLLAALAIAALAGGALGCSDDRPAAAEGGHRGDRGAGGERGGRGGDKSAQAPRPVRLARAEEGRLPRTVEVTGTLAADEQVELAIKVAGRLDRLLVDLGSPVRQGQVVARLAPADFELGVDQAASALAQARARLGLPAQGPDREVDPAETAVVKQAAATLHQAQLTRDRTANLFKDGLVPRSELDAAEAALAVAEGRYQDGVEEAHNRQGLLAQRRSELGLARQRLADSVLTAPFDGMIRERRASSGDYVAAGQPIAVLVRVDPLRLRLAVPEREAAAVRPGQEVRLTLEGDPQTYAGRVARVSPAISEENRTLAVEAEIPNPGGRLRPGSFAHAAIVTRPDEPAVLVPASAVVSFAGVTRVLGVADGKAVEKRVQIGRKVGDRVEVTEGLAAGEPVVLQPGSLVDGDPVEVTS